MQIIALINQKRAGEVKITSKKKELKQLLRVRQEN